jgi:ketosteroid isomerase-like protein
LDAEYTDKFLHVVKTTPPRGNSNSQTVLHRAYDAIIQGDFNLFGESLTDDVELHIRGFGPLDGTWRGRDDVVAATRKNFALVANQKPEVESMISQGDSIAVLLRETGIFKSSGRAYSARSVQWFTFADGKIKKIDEIVAEVLEK